MFALLLRRSTDGHRSFYRASIKGLIECFSRSLPAAWIEWADLNADEMGRTFRDSDDDMFVILVDRKTNFWDDDDLRDTVEHETCHIATWEKDQDAHGPTWRACMARIKAH